MKVTSDEFLSLTSASGHVIFCGLTYMSAWWMLLLCLYRRRTPGGCSSVEWSDPWQHREFRGRQGAYFLNSKKMVNKKRNKLKLDLVTDTQNENNGQNPNKNVLICGYNRWSLFMCYSVNCKAQWNTTCLWICESSLTLYYHNERII